MQVTFVLIHSPLVGPTSWLPVAGELRRAQRHAIVPHLLDDERHDPPAWERDVVSAVAQIEISAHTDSLILVAHSGAGALLPEIGQRLRARVCGYVFVDAVLPLDGHSRLDEMASQFAGIRARASRATVAREGRGPRWTDVDLRPLIPDNDLRRRVLSELQPRPLSYYEEPIPSPVDWTTAPSAYVLFSPTYSSAADRACALGWPVREIPGGHFHMLVEPLEVARALIELSDAWRSTRPQ